MDLLNTELNGAILCSSLGSQAPFPPSSSLLPPAPSSWDTDITTLPNSFEPASPLIPSGSQPIAPRAAKSLGREPLPSARLLIRRLEGEPLEPLGGAQEQLKRRGGRCRERLDLAGSLHSPPASQRRGRGSQGNAEICQCQAELQLANCMCPEGMELAADDVTCMERSFPLEDLPTPSGLLILMMAVVVLLTLSLPTVCGVLILCAEHPAGKADFFTEPTGFLFLPSLVNHKKWQDPWWMKLPGLELQIIKLHISTMRTIPNPYYFQVRLGPGQSCMLPPRAYGALARGVFGETYEGLVIGLPGDRSLLQVTVKVRGVGLLTESGREALLPPWTLPEFCCPQDGLDFLTEALIMGSAIRTSEYCECIRATSGLILLELVSGGDMKGFLSQSQLQLVPMQDLLQLAQDIAEVCYYLEENHFIHRNCLLSCTGSSQVAKIGDFWMQAIFTGPVITTRGAQALQGAPRSLPGGHLYIQDRLLVITCTPLPWVTSCTVS
ncbi:hypothetical protein AB1E18_007963 [Capra hircus]